MSIAGLNRRLEMKVILLFDDCQYREYELNTENNQKLKSGERICVEFCQPDFGEVFHAGIEAPIYNEVKP
jgi:hypothetical protein